MAAKKAAESDGQSTIVSKVKLLAEMRKAVSQGLSDLVKTVNETTVEEMSGLNRSLILSLLKEAAAEQDRAAITKIVAACGDPISSFGTISTEIASGTMAAFGPRRIGADELMSGPDGARKETALAVFLIECVKVDPDVNGVKSVLGSMVEAKVPTDTFINSTLRSRLDFKEKMAAVRLCAKTVAVHDDVIPVLEKQLIDNSYHHNSSLTDAASMETMLSLCSLLNMTDRFVESVATTRECDLAADLVSIAPSTFDAVCAIVLKSGSPRSIAQFYRAHGKRCDKKAFHERLSEAMKPDPAAMADAILEGKRGPHGFFMHPMEMYMMMGPPGRWRY